MNSSDKFITTKDFLVSGKSFDLLYNDDLHLLKTTPVPPLNELSKYYESDEYISHTDDNKGLLQSLYQLVKSWSLSNKVNLINKENRGQGTLLDIGAGTGEFLIAAKKQNWQVYGMEPNATALKLAAGKGLNLELNLSAFDSKKFDVVTLWHVLEHIPDLEDMISQLTDLVKPGGTLIIAVPNYNSYDAKHYGKFWAAYDVPRHLWHFSQESMKKIFKSHFQLTSTRPMIFDSFYVSLLSEKYKTGKKFSLIAFWIGLKSNLAARRNMEYSSLIYCFKRKNDV